MPLTGCWTEENRRALEELLAREYKHTPIAVFDWDGTCMRGDIEDAVFHQVCQDLAFRFDAPGFHEWLTEAHPIDHISATFEEYCAHPTLENRQRLRLRFEQLRKALYEGEDDGAICAWDIGVFIGWLEQEARDYARRVIAQELARPLGRETLAVDGEKIEFARGVRQRPELKELIQAMQRAGWQTWVISASAQWVVEAAAELYGIPPSRVVAMRREVVDGRITPAILPPVSFSDGKLDAYQMFVSRTRPPPFAAGDSLYDWKILEWAEEAHLLVEPAPEPLREFALWLKSEGETWLLQRFD